MEKSRDNGKKRKEVTYMEMLRDSERKRKESPYMEVPHDNDQKSKEVPYMEMSRDTDAYISSNFLLSNHCSIFFLQNQLASFSYQHSISFTHGLQHYCFLG